MQPVTNSLISIIRKAVKLLQRDFFELEMLQSSKYDRNISQFCHQAFSRTKTLLQDELQKHSKYLYFSDQIFALDNDLEVALLVTPVDSLANFAKSLPFFAASITYLKKIDRVLTPVYVVVNFPALGEIYYAEKGAGFWLEKTTHTLDKAVRLRVSGCTNVEQAVIAASPKSIESLTAAVKDTRYFGSDCYHVALFASGKLDAVYLSELPPVLIPGFELIIRESGGLIIPDQYRLVAANCHLAGKLL